MLLLVEEDERGIPFRVSVGSCRRDAEGRLPLLESLLRALGPERGRGVTDAAGTRSIGTRSIDIRSIDIRSIDIRSIDIRSIDIRSIDIRNVGTRSIGTRSAGTSDDRIGRATIRHEPSGRPVLDIPGEESPFISFSTSGEKVWAAVSWDGPVGMDAARPSEFRPPYPLPRVFNPREWEAATAVCSSREDVAPLLWVLKEAAVKALGYGFGEVDPIQVESSGLRRTRGIVRGSIHAGKELSGMALRHGPGLWIGVAWLGKEDHRGLA